MDMVDAIDEQVMIEMSTEGRLLPIEIRRIQKGRRPTEMRLRYQRCRGRNCGS